jgi:hypothetical protein
MRNDGMQCIEYAAGTALRTRTTHPHYASALRTRTTDGDSMRNITFSADETLIDLARAQAQSDNTTLNDQFRLWLAQYAGKRRAQRFRELMDKMQPLVNTGGQKLTRDEMNER